MWFLSDVTHVKVFVLDEADELLSGGFSQAVMDIFHTLPPGVQVINELLQPLTLPICLGISGLLVSLLRYTG